MIEKKCVTKIARTVNQLIAKKILSTIREGTQGHSSALIALDSPITFSGREL